MDCTYKYRYRKVEKGDDHWYEGEYSKKSFGIRRWHSVKHKHRPDANTSIFFEPNETKFHSEQAIVRAIKNLKQMHKSESDNVRLHSWKEM